MLLRDIPLVHSCIVALSGIFPAEASSAAVTSASAQNGWQTQLSDIQSDWQRYVRSPRSQTVKPIRIVSNYTQGNVTNPEGLLDDGKGATILKRPSPSDTIPAIVVDFGQNVAGYLSIDFAGARNTTPGLPGIRLAFSESIQYGYLTDVSDFSRSYNVSLLRSIYSFTTPI